MGERRRLIPRKPERKQRPPLRRPGARAEAAAPDPFPDYFALPPPMPEDAPAPPEPEPEPVVVAEPVHEVPAGFVEGLLKKRKGPVKYRPEFADEMLAFFTPELVEEDATTISESGAPTRRLREFPTFVAFARKIGVTERTVRNWASAVDEEGQPLYPEFVEAIEEARAVQTHMLIQGGLTGAYKERIVTFVAVNLTELRTNPPETVDENDKALSSEALDALYASAMEKATEGKRLAYSRSAEVEQAIRESQGIGDRPAVDGDPEEFGDPVSDVEDAVILDDDAPEPPEPDDGDPFASA